MEAETQTAANAEDQGSERVIPLLQLVARRADELWRERRFAQGDLECWLRAEREIFEQQGGPIWLECETRPQGASTAELP